jgi:hypothetical protein
MSNTAAVGKCVWVDANCIITVQPQPRRKIIDGASFGEVIKKQYGCL